MLLCIREIILILLCIANFFYQFIIIFYFVYGIV